MHGQQLDELIKALKPRFWGIFNTETYTWVTDHEGTLLFYPKKTIAVAKLDNISGLLESVDKYEVREL